MSAPKANPIPIRTVGVLALRVADTPGAPEVDECLDLLLDVHRQGAGLQLRSFRVANFLSGLGLIRSSGEGFALTEKGASVLADSQRLSP